MTTESEDVRQVVLAYPRTVDGRDYGPDETVSLPAEGQEGAKQLVRDGRARWADNTDEGRPATAAAKKAARTGEPAAPKEA